MPPKIQKKTKTTKAAKAAQSMTKILSTLKKKRKQVAGRKSDLKSVTPEVKLQAAPVTYGRTTQSKPPIISTKGNVTTIMKSEFVQDITSSTGFAVSTFPINPSNSALLPWLSQMATGFTQFVFRQLVFRLVTTSTTGVKGNWILSAIWDALELVFVNKQQMLDYGNAKEASAWKDCKFVCDPQAMSYFNRYFNYVNAGVPAGADPKTYNVGQIAIGTSGQAASGDIIGELHVDYEVELMVPNIQGPLDNFDSGYFIAYGNTNNYGALVPHSNNTGVRMTNFPIAKTASSFGLSFSRYGSGQEYLICTQLLMTSYVSGSYSIGSTVTVSGATIVNCESPAGYSISSDWLDISAGAALGALSYMYIVPTQADVGFINIFSSITGTISKMILWVTPITPDNLSFHNINFGRKYAFDSEGTLLYNVPHKKAAPVRKHDLKQLKFPEPPNDDVAEAVHVRQVEIDDGKFPDDLKDVKGSIPGSDIKLGFLPSDNPSEFKLNRNRDGSRRTYNVVTLDDGTKAMVSDPRGKYYAAEGPSRHPSDDDADDWRPPPSLPPKPSDKTKQL